MKLLHPDELRFMKLSPGPEPTDIGRYQFYYHESHGVYPTKPDPFFLRLLDGKRWWEWTVKEWRTLYYNYIEWPGWEQVKQDFKNDPRGFKMIFGNIYRGSHQ